MITMLDIIKANNKAEFVPLVEEAAKMHPEITRIPARTVPGLKYLTLVRTAIGNTTGSYRKFNAGTTPISHTYENREVDMFTVNPIVQADKALANGYVDGPAAFMAMQVQGAIEGEMQGMASQFYYGSTNNADGHPGLIDVYDSANMVVDATGTTASTGSSVWLVATGPAQTMWAFGQNGTSLTMSDPTEMIVTDPNDSAKRYTALASSGLWYAGLQVCSQKGIVRIKKLTADTGKGLSDSLLSQALQLAMANGIADGLQWFMSPRSLFQLQRSRTATTPAGEPAPIPTQAFGIPINVTNAIVDTESLTL